MLIQSRVSSWFIALVMVAAAPAAPAVEPYTPASNGLVLLQRVPGEARALRQLRGIQPRQDAALRLAAAQAAIDQGHRSGDPRYFGQAQALLGSDWLAADPPPAARLLRAILRQQRHDFAAALADLDVVLAAEPGNAQARLVRANIRMVQGEPLRARGDCTALIGQAGFLVVATCIGSVDGLAGKAASARQTIETVLVREPDAPAGVRIWALTQLAEIAERLGDLPAAAEFYARALDLAETNGDNDVYLKAAHADFLLDQQRAAEVKVLLGHETRADALLLRLALAEQQLAQAGDAEAGRALARQLQTLEDRFALVSSRGDPPHRREQAMTALYLRHDAKAALQLARQNWAEQREPADARLLLSAALKAQDQIAAQPVLDWMQQTGIEDRRLKVLAARLGAKP